MIVSIAWRNVWRNKVRSLVVIAAIALGLWGGIFSYAFMQGMTGQQTYSSIHTETGHLQLNSPKFLLNYDLHVNVANADEVQKEIATMPGVLGVSSSIQLTSIASTAYASAGTMVTGVDTANFRTVSELDKYLVKGDFLGRGRSNQVLIGQQLAEKLHAGIHSRLVFTLQSYSGEITYSAFKVVGIYKLHNSEFNERMVFVRKSDLQKIIGFPAGSASAINVLLDNDEATAVTEAELKNKFPELQVQSWQELSPMLQLMSGTIDQMSFIFVFIILLALAFGIVNTMLMAVMDRTRELGVLLCIGMNRAKVFRMIVLETIFLSFTGAVVGLLLSIVTVSYFGTRGIDLSLIADGINALGFSSHVYPKLDFGFYPKFAAMVIIISLFSSFFPARRATRLNPAEAVRQE